MPKKNIASAMKISRMALWKIEQNHKEYGEDGLKDHKPGRLFEPLSRNFYDLVIEYWKKYKCGARKLYAILKNKGFKVSLKNQPSSCKGRLPKTLLAQKKAKKIQKIRMAIARL